MKEQCRAAEHVDRAAQLYAQGRFEDAIAELQIALRIDPVNPVAHGNMGAVLLGQGKPKEAIPWLEKALELHPTLEGVPAALARAKATSKANEGACFIATACYGEPDCPEVTVLRAYRDERLAKSPLGRRLIRAYYALSPSVAAWLKRHPALRSIVRERVLRPLVHRIQKARRM